jgi:hypothetical protein
MGPEVNRSILKILHNTLPESCLGRWLSDVHVMQLRVKPAIDNTTIMIEVAPLFLVLDASSRIERFRFQTGTTFSFSGTHSRNYIDGLILYLANLCIDEFNDALQQTKSLLVVHRKFEKMTMQELKPKIDQAFAANYWKTAGVKPYWKTAAHKSEAENDSIIADLPPVPYFKQFKEKFTQEQSVLNRCFQGTPPGEEDLQLLRESIEFNRECFKKLQEIDLILLNEKQYLKLKDYLRYVYSTGPCIFNEVSAGIVYRVTIVGDNLLEDGKLRKSKYLSYPPLEVVRERGKFNRANSPDRTLFYAADQENVAIREMKPSTGSRIIISSWMNHAGKSLNCLPICMTAGINNDMADKASYAFEMIKEQMHPQVAEWMAGMFEFLASEFIKEAEPTNFRRYDYLFTAIFADGILQGFPNDSNVKDYDAIVYPSVAWHHLPNNLAVLPAVIDSQFSLKEAKEFQVLETWYDKEIALDQMPARLSLVRKATGFSSGNITWDDD